MRNKTSPCVLDNKPKSHEENVEQISYFNLNEIERTAKLFQFLKQGPSLKELCKSYIGLPSGNTEIVILRGTSYWLKDGKRLELPTSMNQFLVDPLKESCGTGLHF